MMQVVELQRQRLHAVCCTLLPAEMVEWLVIKSLVIEAFENVDPGILMLTKQQVRGCVKRASSDDERVRKQGASVAAGPRQLHGADGSNSSARACHKRADALPGV
jgi:hypothetical protein